MKVIADHATARHTSQMSTDFSFTLPPPVVSVSCFSKRRHCVTKGERFGNSTVGSGTPAVEHSRRSERGTKERRTRSGPPGGGLRPSPSASDKGSDHTSDGVSVRGLSRGERRKRIGPPRGGPTTFLVGPRGLEPRTSPLSGVRSHHP